MPSRRGSTRSIVASTCTRAPGEHVGKAVQAPNQPACGEHRGDRDRDHLGIAFLDECKTAFDLVEASREVGTELRACCRRHHTACLSAEQHATEAGFQLPDLLDTAPGVTRNSSAARRRVPRRATASAALSAARCSLSAIPLSSAKPISTTRPYRVRSYVGRPLL